MLRRSLLAAVCVFSLCASVGLGQQRAGLLRGQVSDELGALVVGATVTLVAADGTENTATTNNEGVYVFNTVAPGTYTLRVVAPGFSQYEAPNLSVISGQRTTHDVRLVVTLE